MISLSVDDGPVGDYDASPRLYGILKEQNQKLRLAPISVTARKISCAHSKSSRATLVSTPRLIFTRQLSPTKRSLLRLVGHRKSCTTRLGGTFLDIGDLLITAPIVGHPSSQTFLLYISIVECSQCCGYSRILCLRIPIFASHFYFPSF